MAVRYRGRMSSKSRPFDDIGRRQPLFSQGLDGFSFVAFCQSAASGIQQEWVVSIEGDWQLQQFLEQSVQVSGFEQIMSSRNVCDALDGIVMDDAQVITAADVAAYQNDITEEFGSGQLRSADEVDPFEWLADSVERRIEVQSQGKLIASLDSELSFVCGQAAACTGVERAFGTVRGSTGRRDFPLNFLSCAEAGVKESALQQIAGGQLIVLQVL